MVGKRPIKFRMLQLFLDGKEHWSSDVVKQLQTEYGMNSGYGRDSINFDLIELATGGMLKEVEVKPDSDGSYKKGALLHKYVITAYGKTRATETCKVSLKEA